MILQSGQGRDLLDAKVSMWLFMACVMVGVACIVAVIFK